MENLPADDLAYILQHTHAVWSEFKNARLFITGGTGFIGTWLVEAFLRANQEYQLNLSITVLTRQRLRGTREKEFVQGDVRHFDYPAGEFTHVIHGATDACATLNASQPLTMFSTITNGTQRVLEFAHSVNAKKVLFLSSGAVYGKQPETLSQLPESYQGVPDNLNPLCAYSIGKHTAEHICALCAQRYELDIRIARLFAFVGPYLPLDKHYAVGNFIRDGLAGDAIQLSSDGSALRSYLYAADLVICLLHIFCFGKTMQPYNVGSEQAVSILELAKIVAAQFNPSPAIRIGRAQRPERYIPDVSRLRQAFDLRALVPLNQAICKTINWYRDHAKSQ